MTVLEILAEEHPSSPRAAAIVEAALVQLKERRDELEDQEAQSLQSSLRRLRNRSIGYSIRELAAGLDPKAIDGYPEGDIGAFIGRCYTVRSQLVHNGRAPEDFDVGKLAGSLFFLLRHMLTHRIDG